MIFLYYAYGGIRSTHPHIAINKANGLVAAALLTPNWPDPSPLVVIPNWDDDIYLIMCGADAFFTPGSPNQSYIMLSALSSFYCCGPADQPQYLMPPPAHP
jgi:hypothetical protein